MSYTLSKSLRHIQRYQGILLKGRLTSGNQRIASLSILTRGQTNTNNEVDTTICRQHNLIKLGAFSTKADTNTDADATAEASENVEITDTIPLRFPNQKSSLLSTLPSDHTSGQAWNIIQTNYCKGSPVRHSDFQTLCNASQPKSPTDFKTIRQAICEIYRCNNFQPSIEDAKCAVEGMMRSLLYVGGVEGTASKFQIRAGVLVGKVLIDKKSGLYVAAETDVVNESILKTLWMGVEKGYVQPDAEESGGDNEENSAKDEFSLEAVTDVTKNIVDMLMLRASNPTRDMKKRAKRKYLRYSRCSSGPTPETIDYAVKICLKAGDDGLGVAKEILDEYAQRPFLGAAMSDTIALVQEKEDEKLAASAAEAAANEEEEEVDAKE